MSFASTFIKKSGTERIYLAQYESENGIPIWCYIFVDKNKIKSFLSDSANGEVDMEKYGEILAMGFGDSSEPPEEIKLQMKQKYGFSG